MPGIAGATHPANKHAAGGIAGHALCKLGIKILSVGLGNPPCGIVVQIADMKAEAFDTILRKTAAAHVPGFARIVFLIFLASFWLCLRFRNGCEPWGAASCTSHRIYNALPRRI